MNVALIEVANGEAEERVGTDKVTGRPKYSYAQKAYLHQGEEYPLPFEIVHDDNRKTLAAGYYLLGSNAFRPGRWGPEFQTRRAEYVPVADALKLLQAKAAPAKASA